MIYILKTYSGQSADFYIQCKGLNSGRPLAAPITNSFAVSCQHPELKQITQALFLGRYFQPHISGSVIPFITKNSIKQILDFGISNHNPSHLPKLHTVETLDQLIYNKQEQIKLLRNYKIVLCRSLFA